MEIIKEVPENSGQNNNRWIEGLKDWKKHGAWGWAHGFLYTETDHWQLDNGGLIFSSSRP